MATKQVKSFSEFLCTWKLKTNKQQQETDTRKQITWQYKVPKSSAVEYATGFVTILKCDFSFYTEVSFLPQTGVIASVLLDKAAKMPQ